MAAACVILATSCSSALPGGMSPREVRTNRDVRIGTTYRFEMVTHCGAEETMLAGEFWQAAPGSRTPSNWNDPVQKGTVTRTSETKAVFEAKGYQLHLQLRIGATDFLRLCA